MYLTVSVAGWHENKMSILNHIMYLVIVMLGQTEGLNFISTLLSENQNIFIKNFMFTHYKFSIFKLTEVKGLVYYNAL